MSRSPLSSFRIPRRLTPKSALKALLSLAILLAINAFHSTASPRPTTSATRQSTSLPSKGTIERVIDGDTVAVRFDGAVEKVRLIGVDTPEKRPSKRASLQSARSHQSLQSIMELGERASRMMRELAPEGLPVTIEYDVTPRDKYGRLLGHLFTQDGTMLNEEIIKRGYAQLLTIPPNVKYVSRFQMALTESRAARRGLWADGGFEN